MPTRRFGEPRRAKDAEHGIVYRREDEFASHPYVRGFWETAAGHLICNFSLATVNYRGDPHHLAHTYLVRNNGGRRSVTVRSEDRGRTWYVSDADRRRPSNDVLAPRPGIDGRPEPLHELGPIDYTDKDVLLSNFSYLYMNIDPLVGDFYEDLKQFVESPERQAFVRVSKDGGNTWSRSAMLPLDGLYGLSAVESSTVRLDGQCLLFMNGTARPGGMSRPLVYRSTDDGTTFHFLSYVTPNDESRYGNFWQLYPRGLMLPNGRLLCTLRLDRDWSGAMWTEVYASDDGGRTWGFLSRISDFGAPGAPLLLSDGRIVIVYGTRVPPAGIRAVVSEDEGQTWSPEIIVRDDAGSWDIGYPRVWEAEPGRIGTVYYFNDKDDPVQVRPVDTLWGAGGVRYIARSFFSID